jgi:hypothetical protein
MLETIVAEEPRRRSEVFAEFCQCTVQHAVHRRNAHLHRTCHFCPGQSLKVKERDRLPVILRQRAKRYPNGVLCLSRPFFTTRRTLATGDFPEEVEA